MPEHANASARAAPPNVDAHEIAKFSSLAHAWWDPKGPCKPLHELNPCRLGFIESHVSLAGSRVLDLGCGGGILSESLYLAGADVVGIDANAELIEVATRHAPVHSGDRINYRCTSIEQFAQETAPKFDVITCMELIEHVPDPAALIRIAAQCLSSSGRLFFSTIARTPRAYLEAILGAEYVFGLLPRGTHDYHRFINPSELSRWARAADLSFVEIAGMSYNPLLGHARLRRRVDVNFLACFEKN